MLNQVKIKISEETYRSLRNKELIPVDCLIEVEVNDNNLFENDVIWDKLKKASIKAYKDLKEYEFNKRHNIKKY